MGKPFRLGSPILALVIPGTGLRAQEAHPKSFSARTAIEERLETARAELKALPESAEPIIRESLQRLEAACQYHLGTIDFLTTARDDVRNAEQEASVWSSRIRHPR